MTRVGQQQPVAMTVTTTALAGKGKSVGLLLVAQVLAMAVWFSSTAVVPAIKAESHASSFMLAMLTSAVQLGFVAGTLISAAFRLADRMHPRRLFFWAALAAGGLTGCLALLPALNPSVIVLRFATGMCLAGVYPVGLKIAATWADRDLGLLMGALVGALTVGSASPHLGLALFDLGSGRQFVYLAAGVAAALAAVLITQVRVGPNAGRPRGPTRFGSGLMIIWRNRPIRLANCGYLGHMWELYAMWAWLGVFLNDSFKGSGAPDAHALAEGSTFLIIAAGAAGAVLGGAMADRIGRTATTVTAMAGSATCALSMGWLYGRAPILILLVGLLWGVTVIADSAQFSASIAELSEPEDVGTMLTLQTSCGFLLTLASIQLLGPISGHLGWRVAFSMLAVGPMLGCVAMLRLRSDPAATRLAGGRR